MRWPVPLLLTLPAAFALAWAASRVFAYYVWPVDVVVADFAAMALPSHYDVTAIVAGFRDAVIVPLKSVHLLSIRVHVAFGAVATVAFTHQLAFNTRARGQHRAVAPIANISALGLAAMSIYAMFIREGGMVPVGFAAWLTNIVALVLMVGGIVVGVAAVKSSRPNFVLHRRAMIVAAGGLFMNAAQRFALVVVAHVPALVPASQNTWPQYRDGAWEAGLYAGTAVCFAGAAAYAWGALGTGAAAAAALQAQVDGVTARKRE